ncbi:NB-ARC domain-containing protein [Saccharothrix longispora]|uniref:EF-hand domain-containing protein n=1 Tax=Saccharothrix longispora TaxID=33920 RepID=A0ABU1PVM2_9PSEU|nr:hypothetical protein [Saccharothrix longispora]
MDLRGFSPTGEPVEPAVAVRGFLDAQAALYRSLVAGRRMLIMLDNAATANQVVPLLPGSPSCTVLVTGRHRLASLIDRYGARHLPLDVLSPEEARGLLAARLGADRVAAEPEAVEELIGLCGGHPLALSIIARTAGPHPDIALAEAAAELRDLGLEALDHDIDLSASLPTVLSWSLRHLTDTQRTVFVLLGIAPGPDTHPARHRRPHRPARPPRPQDAERAGERLATGTAARWPLRDARPGPPLRRGHHPARARAGSGPDPGGGLPPAHRPRRRPPPGPPPRAPVAQAARARCAPAPVARPHGCVGSAGGRARHPAGHPTHRRHPRPPPHRPAPGLEPADLARPAPAAHPGGGDAISREQFVSSTGSLSDDPEAARASVDALAEASLAIADTDVDGRVSPDEYAVFLRGHFPGLTEAEAAEAFAHLDADGDGHLTAEEFIRACVEFWSSTDPDASGTGGWAARSRDPVGRSGGGSSG